MKFITVLFLSLVYLALNSSVSLAHPSKLANILEAPFTDLLFRVESTFSSPERSGTSHLTTGFHLTKRNIIILDWDNTLFPDAVVNSEDHPLVLNAGLADDLAKHQDSLVHFLNSALAVNNSKVYLLTNASLSWVMETAKLCLPKVIELLPKITVISARDLFAHAHPQSGYDWKKMAIPRILEGEKKADLNVISIGDAENEKRALIHLRTANPEIMGKTVKFMENPSVDQLRLEIELTESRLIEFLDRPTAYDFIMSYYQLYGRESEARPRLEISDFEILPPTLELPTTPSSPEPLEE